MGVTARQGRAEVFPNPFCRAHFRGVWWVKNKAYIGWSAQFLRDMCGGLIQHQHVECGGRCLGEVLKKKLEQAGVQSWQFQKKTLPRQRFDAPVKHKALTFVLIRRAGFDATQRQPTAQGRDQPEVTFVLCPDA